MASSSDASGAHAAKSAQLDWARAYSTDSEPSLSEERQNSIPDWSKDPLLQGIEDGEQRSTNRDAMGCLSTKVKVKGTEIMKDKNPYVVYVIQISSISGSWNVRRRYTDFSYLHAKLKGENLPSLPKLPPKQFVGSSLDAGHIDQRKKALSDYLIALVATPDVWLTNHIVLFLDNDNRSLMFLWNVEKMRRLQGLLNSMTSDMEQQDGSEVAQDRMTDLKEKVANLEMFFLQHATGAARETLSSSKLRSLSGADEEEAEKSRLRIGSDLADFDALDISGEVGAGAAEVNRKLSAAVAAGSLSKMTTSQVLEVLDLAVSPSLDKDTITSGSLRRKSAADVTGLAISLQLQETLRMSKQVLPGTPKLGNRKSLNKVPSSTPRSSDSFESPMVLMQLTPFEGNVTTQVDAILDGLVPSQNVLDLRERVVDYVKGLALVTHHALVYPVGTYIRDSFSPEGDMDLTLCLTRAQFHHPFLALNEALCTSSMKRGKGDSSMLDVSNVSYCTSNSIKKCKANISGVSVDISANQLRRLMEVIFLETIDDFIGKDHLFKKSLLLVKAWLFFEAPRYTSGNDELFGESSDCISSWALSIMMILVFNVHGDKIEHPLRALGIFLEFYNAVDFESSAVTVHGLTSADTPTSVSPVADYLSQELLQSAKQHMMFLERASFKHLKASKASAEKAGIEEEDISETEDDVDEDLVVGDIMIESEEGKSRDLTRHPFISCFNQAPPAYEQGFINIMDPLVETQNICSNMEYQQFSSLKNAFSEGLRAYRAIFEASTEETRSESVKSFLELTNVYARGVRADGSQASPAFFDCRKEEFQSSLEIMQMILCSIPSIGGLSRMVTYILEQRGPLPIGEVGKQLIEFTKSDLLVRNIKQKFGGLKKAIEKLDDIFELGTDHPFNPLVSIKTFAEDGSTAISFPVSHGEGPETFLPSSKANMAKLQESKRDTGKSFKSSADEECSELSNVSSRQTDTSKRSRGSRGPRGNRGDAFYPRRGKWAEQDGSKFSMYPSMGYTLYGWTPQHFIPLSAAYGIVPSVAGVTTVNGEVFYMPTVVPSDGVEKKEAAQKSCS